MEYLYPLLYVQAPSQALNVIQPLVLACFLSTQKEFSSIQFSIQPAFPIFFLIYIVETQEFLYKAHPPHMPAHYFNMQQTFYIVKTQSFYGH